MRYILFLILLINQIYVSGQNPAGSLMLKKFYLTRIDIREEGKYPVIMHGLSEIDLSDSLKLTNTDSLYAKFYSYAYYTPDILEGMKAAILAFMDKEYSYEYLKRNQRRFSELYSEINRVSRKSQYKLGDGKTVYIQSAKMYGAFWLLPKGLESMAKSSNEIDITKFEKWKGCYIPCEITVIKE